MKPYVSVGEDGAVVLEFIMPDNSERMAVFFEPKPEDSGWCYASRDDSLPAEKRIDCGGFDTLPLEMLQRFAKFKKEGA